jgi:hypothetical protein
MKTARILSNLKITKILSPRVTWRSAESNRWRSVHADLQTRPGLAGFVAWEYLLQHFLFLKRLDTTVNQPFFSLSLSVCLSLSFWYFVLLVTAVKVYTHEWFSTYRIRSISWFFSYRHRHRECSAFRSIHMQGTLWDGCVACHMLLYFKSCEK